MSSDFVQENESEIPVTSPEVKLGQAKPKLTKIAEETNEEYHKQNTHEAAPAEFSSKQGNDLLDALKDDPDPAATLSKTTTRPETKRGTVSNDLSDDELEADDVMNALA